MRSASTYSAATLLEPPGPVGSGGSMSSGSISRLLTVGSPFPAAKALAKFQSSRRSRTPAPDLGWSDDMSVKIHQICYVLKDRIAEVKKAMAEDVVRYTYTNKQYAKECGASEWVNEHSQGLPFDKLLDLKMTFDTDGGFDEVEFIMYFAPVFCSATDPALVKIWFLTIDERADGQVDWDEFSAYLSKACSSEIDRPKPAAFTQKCIESPNAPMPLLHGLTNIATNSLLKEIYTAASDGTVHIWDAGTLYFKGVLHYGNGSLVHTLKYIPTSNQVLVGQHDRTTFIYYRGGNVRTSTRIERVYRGLKELPTDVSYRSYDYRIQRTCEFDPKSKLMERGCGQGILGLQGLLNTDVIFPSDEGPKNKSKKPRNNLLGNHYIDVTVMCGLDRDVYSMEPLRALADRYQDPFAYGLEDGTVQVWSLAEKISKPGESGERTKLIRPHATWQPHAHWVTQIAEARELGGFLSASLDNTVRVFDLEKEKTTTTLALPATSTNTHGIYAFDHSAERNLLCTIGVTREAVIWNPKAGQRMCTLSDHKAPLVGAQFLENMAQLVTVSEDKVIKIYDVRTFCVVQTLTDKQKRYPHDRHSALAFDHDTNTIIVGGGGAPLLWRESMAQAKMETGSSFALDYDGHILPVIACLYNSRMLQMVTADEQNVRIWDIKTGKTLSKWSPFSEGAHLLGNLEPLNTKEERIQRLSLDHDRRRLLLGYEGGVVDMCALDGRRLKTFAPKTSFDLTSLTHVVANETHTHAQAFVLVGGYRDKLWVWHDLPETTVYTTSQHIKRHVLSTRESAVQSVVFFPPNKAVAGTVTGKVVLFNLNNFSVLSVSDSVVRVGRQLAASGHGFHGVVAGVLDDAQSRRRGLSSMPQLLEADVAQGMVLMQAQAQAHEQQPSHAGTPACFGRKRVSIGQRGAAGGTGRVSPLGRSGGLSFLALPTSLDPMRPHSVPIPAAADMMLPLPSPRQMWADGAPGSPGASALSQSAFDMPTPRGAHTPRSPSVDVYSDDGCDGGGARWVPGETPTGRQNKVRGDRVELGFANFRARVLTKMQVVIEKILCIRGEYVVSLHGNGDASVWHMVDGYSFHVLLKIPASFSPGELVHEVDFSHADSLLYIADAEAKISVFDLSRIMADDDEEEEGGLSRSHTSMNQSGGSGGGGGGVGLTVNTRAAQASSEQGSMLRTLPAIPGSRHSSAKSRRGGGGGGGSRGSTAMSRMRRYLADAPQVVHAEYINVHLVRFVTCHDFAFAQKITALQVLPDGSPVAVVTQSDCSMTIFNRHTGHLYSRLGARVQPRQPWPAGLPSEDCLNISEDDAVRDGDDAGSVDVGSGDGAAGSAPLRRLKEVTRRHRFVLMFPEDDTGTPSPRAADLSPAGRNKRGSKWNRVASAAGLSVTEEESQQLRSIQVPATRNDFVTPLDPIDQVDLESLATSSPAPGGDDAQHNQRMYMRYCLRHEPQDTPPAAPDAPYLHELAMTGSLASTASTRIDAQLKSQHRTKAKGRTAKTDHFAYTTVRQLRNIPRPTFKKCPCAGCKNYKGTGRAPGCEKRLMELPL